ncbi:MAG: WG repeat-containing protein [Pyrinomonadaceae bacterium]
MRKVIKLLLALSALFCVFQITANSSVKSDKARRLFYVVLNGKIGFIDKSGRVVIKPQFSVIDDFSEGLALVSWGSDYGFIDETGKVIAKPQYDYSWGFREGFAGVQIRDK